MRFTDRLLAGGAVALLAAVAGAQVVTEQGRYAFDPAVAWTGGFALAVDGGTMVVGARPIGGQGNAVVLIGGGASWTEQSLLPPPFATSSGNYGEAVALEGDVAVVGDPNDDVGPSNGTASVFRRAGGVWSLEQRLFPAGSVGETGFGHSLAIDGDTILGGAPDENVVGPFSGAAYFFHRVGGTWIEGERLQADDAAEEQHFGSAVALDGGLAFVGADFSACKPGSGAVYVFELVGSTWTQTAKLVGDVGGADGFGGNVALCGDVLAVSAGGEPTAGAGSGAAYVFERDASGWQRVARLTAFDASPGDAFGVSIALAGERVVVGAFRAGVAPQGPGAGYVYEPDGEGSWRMRSKLVLVDARDEDELGRAVAVQSGFVHLGAPGVDPRGLIASYRDELAPELYCTGKTSSLGCVPFLRTFGAASESGSGPMRVLAHDVLPSEIGILLYGFGPSELPFHGGTLCVKGPLVRFPAKAAVADPASPCGGRLAKDFQTAIRAGADPRLTAGQLVHAQWRQRDPNDPAGFGDGLSDAVRFAIGP